MAERASIIKPNTITTKPRRVTGLKQTNCQSKASLKTDETKGG